MRLSTQSFGRGNVLLCVMCTILVVSVIGGNVLLNCMTRYNAASSQVRSWKESLDAAETGGDIAYAEVRKTNQDPTHAFSGWTYFGGVFTKSPVRLEERRVGEECRSWWAADHLKKKKRTGLPAVPKHRNKINRPIYHFAYNI